MAWRRLRTGQLFCGYCQLRHMWHCELTWSTDCDWPVVRAVGRLLEGRWHNALYTWVDCPSLCHVHAGIASFLQTSDDDNGHKCSVPQYVRASSNSFLRQTQKWARRDAAGFWWCKIFYYLMNQWWLTYCGMLVWRLLHQLARLLIFKIVYLTVLAFCANAKMNGN